MEKLKIRADLHTLYAVQNSLTCMMIRYAQEKYGAAPGLAGDDPYHQALMDVWEALHREIEQEESDQDDYFRRMAKDAYGQEG